VQELALKQILSFEDRRPVIGVDMILRRPATIRASLSVIAKRLAFRNVDYFVHYFKDLRALESVYRIGPDRSGFVDFKANLWNRRVEGLGQTESTCCASAGRCGISTLSSTQFRARAVLAQLWILSLPRSGNMEAGSPGRSTLCRRCASTRS